MITNCPKGKILRKSYKSQSGKRVNAKCITKTGIFNGKSADRQKQLIKAAAQRANTAVKLSKIAHLPIPKDCDKGKTLRKGYTRKAYTRKTGIAVRSALIQPGCIKTRGKQSQSQSQSQSHKSALFILDPEDHYLSEFGYYDVAKKTIDQRFTALHKVIKHFIPIKGTIATYNYVIHALNARYILNRNTNHKTANIFKHDQRIISKEYKIIKKNIKKITS